MMGVPDLSSTNVRLELMHVDVSSISISFEISRVSLERDERSVGNCFLGVRWSHDQWYLLVPVTFPWLSRSVILPKMKKNLIDFWYNHIKPFQGLSTTCETPWLVTSEGNQSGHTFFIITDTTLFGEGTPQRQKMWWTRPSEWTVMIYKVNRGSQGTGLNTQTHTVWVLLSVRSMKHRTRPLGWVPTKWTVLSSFITSSLLA
jgi:hypothetical protein